MSWLSSFVKKIRGENKLPPINLPTIAGGLAKPVGAAITTGLTAIGQGASAGQAVGIVGTQIGNTASAGAHAAVEGVRVGASVQEVLGGPIIWLVLGILFAALLHEHKG